MAQPDEVCQPAALQGLSLPSAIPAHQSLEPFQKGLWLPASQLLEPKLNQGKVGGTRQRSSPGPQVTPDGCQLLIHLGRIQGVREGREGGKEGWAALSWPSGLLGPSVLSWSPRRLGQVGVW